MRRHLVFLALLAVLSCTACSRTHFDGGKYRDREVAFQLGPVPAGMRQIKSTDAKLSFQNDQAGTTIAVGARCGQDSDDIPLRALAQHLFLQFEDRQSVAEHDLTLDDRAALQMELVARLDGVRRHFVIFVLKKDGCVYDFLHVDRGEDTAPVQQSRNDFRTMVSGFRTID